MTMENQTHKNVYQTDAAGLLLGTTVADASPLEEGVWHTPAGCVETPPPETWPDDKWPRWHGSGWELIDKPKAPPAPEPMAKLLTFLGKNPDVAKLLQQLTNEN